MAPVDPIEVYSPHCQCSNHRSMSTYPGGEDQRAMDEQECDSKYDRPTLQEQLKAATPYPMFCTQPMLCAGEGYCKRDPCCAD